MVMAMHPRTMLLTVSALATLSCSNGGHCSDGTPLQGFCAASDGSVTDAFAETGPLGFYGYGDAAAVDASMVDAVADAPTDVAGDIAARDAATE